MTSIVSNRGGRLLTLASAAVLGAACSGVAPDGDQTRSPATSIAPAAQLDGQESLDAGTYIVGAVEPLLVTVTVPDGWQAIGDWAVAGPEGSGSMAMSFWFVANVYAAPRHPDRGLLDPPVGPSVDDLAEALSVQPGQEIGGSNITFLSPVDISLDGYEGRQVVLTGPREDYSGCWFRMWETADGDYRCREASGQVDKIVILDVAGERLVIDRQYFPETSPGDRAELEQVFESIQIEAP